MAIPTLPVELIGHILDLAAEHDLDAPREAYPTLRSAALVSSMWRVPACEVLWRRVSVETDAQVAALAGSTGKGVFRTTAVYVNGENGTVLVPILTGLVGVRVLRIGPECVCAPLDFLYLPALANLQILNVRCNLTHLNVPPLPPPSLRLTHLTIASWLHSPAVATAVLFASANTLHTLDLAGLAFTRNQRWTLAPLTAPSDDATSLPDLLSTLSLQPTSAPPTLPLPPSSPVLGASPTFALPNLDTLKFGHHAIDYALAVLPTAIHLRHIVTSLDTPADLKRVLDAVAHPLVSLALTWTRDYDEADQWGPQADWDGIGRTLANSLNTVALSRLQFFRTGLSREFLEGFAAGEALVRGLDAKGVRLEPLSKEQV